MSEQAFINVCARIFVRVNTDRVHDHAREVEICVQLTPMILATIPIGVGVSEHNIGVR